jgi:thiol-disulfide isomerase/thioredoxin
LLAVVLLTLGQAGPQADGDALAPLLKALDLRGYPSGTRPPNFSGDTLGAHQLSLASLRGKVVIVNFWASWCVDCRPEMPVLERLHREAAGQGLAVVGINARESSQTVQRYARELDLTFPLVLDRNGAINSLYGVVGLPTTFVIDREGLAVSLAVGPRDWGGRSARTLIDTLLHDPARR